MALSMCLVVMFTSVVVKLLANHTQVLLPILASQTIVLVNHLFLSLVVVFSQIRVLVCSASDLVESSPLPATSETDSESSAESEADIDNCKTTPSRSRSMFHSSTHRVNLEYGVENVDAHSNGLWMLDHYCSDSIQAHFYGSLANTFARADSLNLGRLTMAYPVMASLFLDWQKDHNDFYQRHHLRP